MYHHHPNYLRILLSNELSSPLQRIHLLGWRDNSSIVPNPKEPQTAKKWNFYESGRKAQSTSKAHQWSPHGAAGKRFLWRWQLHLGVDCFGGDHGRFANWWRWPGRLGVSWARRDGVRSWAKRVDNIDRLGARLVSVGFGQECSPCCLQG